MSDKPKCGATKKQGPGNCARPAGWGTDHVGLGNCKLHGGKTPSGNLAAQKEQARRDVELFGAKRTIAPAEALLELVHWTAGEVDYWRSRVRELETDDLTWGVTREKTGGEDYGTTSEAKPAVEYAMYVDASNRLERYASSALKAGADAAMVQIARGQGALLAGVIQRSLTRQYAEVIAALRQAGQDEAVAIVEAMWATAVATIVPSELRAIRDRRDDEDGSSGAMVPA